MNTRECWPTLNIKKNRPVNEIREEWHIPNSRIELKGFSLFMFETIPQLLDQAEMIRTAARANRKYTVLHTWVSMFSFCDLPLIECDYIMDSAWIELREVANDSR